MHGSLHYADDAAPGDAEEGAVSNILRGTDGAADQNGEQAVDAGQDLGKAAVSSGDQAQPADAVQDSSDREEAAQQSGGDVGSVEVQMQQLALQQPAESSQGDATNT